jgi:hypothetical protein
MTTDYATSPVTGSVYGDDGGLGELMVDAWIQVEVDPGRSGIVWTDQRHLQVVPRGLFLVFEQGCNAEPMVFALKSDPSRDLADHSDFGLHYLPDEPTDPVYPTALKDLYGPVAALIDHLAGESERSLRDRSLEVMTLLLDRIAELGILRAQEFDEDGVRIGVDRDIAAALPAAWAAKVETERSRAR